MRENHQYPTCCVSNNSVNTFQFVKNKLTKSSDVRRNRLLPFVFGKKIPRSNKQHVCLSRPLEKMSFTFTSSGDQAIVKTRLISSTKPRTKRRYFSFLVTSKQTPFLSRKNHRRTINKFTQPFTLPPIDPCVNLRPAKRPF
jgi:hypothetical protein